MRKVAINMIHELARRDSRVVFVGSDLGPGVLKGMKTEMPERFFMEGVSEAYVIGMAAGLAMEGYVPYVNTIATFLSRRCLEQVCIDVCLENLPVRLIASGGGLVYAPLGPTHLATDDIALLRPLPNMTIVAPADASEMERLMNASLDWPGPMYIRLGKGGDPVVSRAEPGFAIGRGIPMRPAGEVLIVSTGVMTGRAIQTAEGLAECGIGCGVLHMHTLKPFDVDGLLTAAEPARLIVTAEEHTRIGGLGSAVTDALAEAGVLRHTLRLALPDRFPEGYGSQDHLLEVNGLQPAQMIERIQGALTGLG